MKKLFAILIFTTCPCFSQWALVSGSEDGYHYVDTTSFVYLFESQDSLTISTRMTKSGVLLETKAPIKCYKCKSVFTKKPAKNNLVPLDAVIFAEETFFTPSQLWIRPYLDRWLERNKKK